MRKTVLIYGILGGVLIALLKFVEYRFLVLEHSLEIYGGIVAVLFASLGIWLGSKLTRTRVVVREVPVHVRVPTTGPFERNDARREQLGITLRNVAGGTVSFGRALAVGGLIALVASVCYVATWEVVYFKIAPDFADKYQAYLIESAREKGESEEAKATRKAQLEQFKDLYDNPAMNAAITLIEPLPLGLIVALVSAGVLSRKRRPQDAATS